MVGQEVTIYGDELMNIPIGNPLKVNYTCDIGTQSGNNFVVNPVEGNIGDHQLVMVFKNGGYTIQTKTITFTVFAAAPVVTKKILCIGDSLLDGGDIYYGPKMREVLAGSTITMLGTVGLAPNKNEGYGGAWYGGFTFWHSHGKFTKANVLNIPAYFADNAIDTPDYVYIQLGINDVFGSSNPTGDGLTDAELNVLLGFADDLIDGFLAFDANLRIILSADPLCCNTLAGWLANYDPATRDQNLYIDIKHKFNQAFAAKYANGVYNARVDCVYDFIYLDRNDGYPKTAGVHTNAVHPDQSGYEQIGQGMGIALNKRLALDLVSSFKPTVLTLGWENDYMTVDFTDNSGGVCQHEIWESKDGGAYSLVTTLAVGTIHDHSLTWQNASMNIKIRAKFGSWYSDYSDVVNYSTPLVLETDQAVLTQVKFNRLDIAAAKTITIAWGDGNTDVIPAGTTSNKTHDYAGTGHYYIILTGDLNSITRFDIYSQIKVHGDVTKWKLPTALTQINMYSNLMTGDISNINIPASVVGFNINNNIFTGSIPNPTGHATNAMAFYVNANSLSSCGITTFRKAGTIWHIQSQNVAFTTAEVDKFLKAAADWYQVNVPTANCAFRMDGVNNGIPTGGAANVDKVRLEGYYTAAGFTATVTVRTA